MTRRYPIGAEPAGAGASFRVWAPKRSRVQVVLHSGAATELTRENDGYFSGVVAEARDGARYRYRLDGGDALPDPASRFQPEGPHGPSQVVDRTAYAWSDEAWRGLGGEDRDNVVLYELHIGTFTPEGTYASAARALEHVRDL